MRTISKDLPVGIILRALGLNNDQEIYEFITDGTIHGSLN
jgi:DNA-directed RNA polymerase beta subunit